MGFRYTTARLAGEQGLTGWVRNLFDGRVEMVLQGPEEGIARMTEMLERHFDGSIRSKELNFEPAAGAFPGFSIVSSAPGR